jgi:ATP-dependent protease HslVU (ClpYQ) peptidase subunit
MTIVAALKYRGRVYMAYDTEVTAGDCRIIIKDPKIVKFNEHFTIGFSGDAQVLTYINKFANSKALEDIETAAGLALYMNKMLKGYDIDAEYELLVVGNHTKTIYLLDSTGSVVEPDCNFWAVGCGSAVCLGALAATNKKGRRAIRECMEITSTYSTVGINYKEIVV